MIAKKAENDGFRGSGKRIPQTAQHGIRVADSFGIDFQNAPDFVGDGNCQLNGREIIIRTVFVAGIGHMILNGSRVQKEGNAVRNGVGNSLFDDSGKPVIRNPAALVNGRFHFVNE